MSAAADFADIITRGLNGHAAAAPADPVTVPATPRLPAPNMAQGTSGVAGPPPPNPTQAFEDAVRRAVFGTPPGGWYEVRP